MPSIRWPASTAIASPIVRRRVLLPRGWPLTSGTVPIDVSGRALMRVMMVVTPVVVVLPRAAAVPPTASRAFAATRRHAGG